MVSDCIAVGNFCRALRRWIDRSQQTRCNLVPTFDQAFSALIEDLQQRRLLDETMVVRFESFKAVASLVKLSWTSHCMVDHLCQSRAVAWLVVGCDDGQVVRLDPVSLKTTDVAECEERVLNVLVGANDDWLCLSAGSETLAIELPE